ncbi:MAG: hypothetical protein KQH83_06400 [Actinobacteria bacterium]|nr:hypothetical protein [Actinomycetota bacterium]
MSLRPELPGDAGVADRDPGPSRLEGAHLLADQAGDRLRRDGFTSAEILRWAEDFIAYRGSGDVESFLGWIAGQEGTPGTTPSSREGDTP